jgi:protein-S-isoprenylcysteine O-methyltransferase Ste14
MGSDMHSRRRTAGTTTSDSALSSLLGNASPIIIVGLPVVARLLVPSPVVVPDPWNYLGIPVLVAGLGFMFWAWSLFKARGTTLRLAEQTAGLITSGPYRFSRNPMYAGALVAVVGVCMLLGSASGFVFPVLYFLVIDVFMVRPEERMLLRQFGEQYAAYTRRVRRWL